MAEEDLEIEKQGAVVTPTALSNLKKKMKEKRLAEQAEAVNIGLKRKRVVQYDELESEGMDIHSTEHFYKVNYERFHIYYRDAEFVKLAERKINSGAGSILKSMLTECYRNHEPYGLTLLKISTLVDSNIQLPVQGSSGNKLGDYLQALSNDDVHFLEKKDEKGGGMYKINYDVISSSLKLGIIETIIQEKWGLIGCRIWKLLLLKNKLDEKQVAKLAMISQKDGRECLYKMMREGFVFLQDVPKTADHSASRTFFLWYVSPERTIKLIIKNSHKTIFNMKTRLKKELHVRKVLLDKMKRLDVVSGQAKLTEMDEKELAILGKIETKFQVSEMRLEYMLMILRDI